MTLRLTLRAHIIRLAQAVLVNLLTPQEIIAWANERIVEWLTPSD